VIVISPEAFDVSTPVVPAQAGTPLLRFMAHEVSAAQRDDSGFPFA
jgi:hypothetical protein